MLVPHRPDAAITAAIFASLPRRSTNVKMGVGSSRKHHHRSGIPHDGRKAGRSRVERPKNHPVWTDRDWRAGGVERVGKTSLRCAVQHVDQTWRAIRGLWFSGKKVLEPNHAHWIKGHIYLSDNVLVAGNTDPLVCAVAKHRQVSLAVHFRDGCFSRHCGWTCEHRPPDLFLLDFLAEVMLIEFALLGSRVRKNSALWAYAAQPR